MTDPVTLTVALIALGLAILIGWLHLPIPPTLDGERWFKVWLATLLRGQADAEGAEPEVWAERVVRQVPYHPMGRLPESKVVDPSTLPVEPALDGELALLQALAAEADVPARWARMYDLDERGVVARLQDPLDLGPDYDPSGWLGPQADWDAVAASAVGEGPLDPALLAASRATWMLVPDPADPAPDVLGALARVLGDRAVVHDVSTRSSDEGHAKARKAILGRRQDDQDFADAVLALVDHCDEVAPGYEDRLVLVASGDAIHLVLEAMRTMAPLRDEVEAVVSVGGAIGGREGVEGVMHWTHIVDWLGANFRHKELDLEALHRVPYVAVQWLDRTAEPPGAFGIALKNARFPAPADPKSPRIAVEPVDLGVLPADEEGPDPELVARALWGVVTCWVCARR